jgi:hypothetical protein
VGVCAPQLEPTQVFQYEMTLRENPGHKPARDLGERAAVEAVRSYPLPDEARALLLSDDRDAERLLVFEPEKAILLTTWDYLRQLEEAQRIQSADAVIEAVRQAGRNPPQRNPWSEHDPDIRDAVKAILTRARAKEAGAVNLTLPYPDEGRNVGFFERHGRAWHDHPCLCLRSQCRRLAGTTPALDVSLHPDLRTMDQCRGRFLRQAVQAAAQAMRVPVHRRAANRHQPLTRRDQRRPAAFQWTKDPDKIIAAVKRGHQVLDSIH